MTYELFKVAAGTRIAQLPSGTLVFCEPDKAPFTVQIVVGQLGQVTVVRTEVSPDCAPPEITIGCDHARDNSPEGVG